METDAGKGKQVVKSIGKAMQFWRKLEGHDQKDFSEVIGTSRSYVAKLENGHVGVSINRIAEIAAALGISPYTLMRGVPEKEELEALLELYTDEKLRVTKAEMEDLFCERLRNHKVPREYYLHLLDLFRSGKYSRVA